MDIRDGERLDEIGFGGLKLIQKPQDFCYGVDAVLLADFAAQRRARRIADLGCGAGVLTVLLLRALEMGYTLRTPYIVGFPGETQEDFQQLMDFTREVRFDRMGAFKYSQEEDTPAAAMPDQVPEEIKEARLSQLMALQAGIRRELNERRVGSECRVLVTGFDGMLYTGRSEMEAPDSDGSILFTAPRELTPGEFVRVRNVRADTYELYGKLCEEEEA